MKGVAKRSAFVIDREGIIRYAEVLESPADLPNFEAINQILSQIAWVFRFVSLKPFNKLNGFF